MFNRNIITTVILRLNERKRKQTKFCNSTKDPTEANKKLFLKPLQINAPHQTIPG